MADKHAKLAAKAAAAQLAHEGAAREAEEKHVY
eukprot:SAG31_NODE_10846_length_1091_cov_1.351815_1_plen_32_part_10